jgi:hypothetical protein
MIDKDFGPILSLVTQRILSIGKKTDYFSKHVNGLITNFSTIRPHSSLPSSPPKPIYHQRNWKIWKKIIDGELKKRKNDRLHNQIDTFAVRTIGCISHSAWKRRKYISSIDFTFCLCLFTQHPFIYWSDSGLHKSFDRKAAIKPGEPTMTIIEDSRNYWLISLWAL